MIDTLRGFLGLAPRWKRPDEQAFLEGVFEGLKAGGESIGWQRIIRHSDWGNPADIVLNLPDGKVAVITFDLNGPHFRGPEKGCEYVSLLRALFYPWWTAVEQANPGVRFRFFLVTDSRCGSVTTLSLHDLYGVDVIDGVWSGQSGVEHLVASIKSRLKSTSRAASTSAQSASTAMNTSTESVVQGSPSGT